MWNGSGRSQTPDLELASSLGPISCVPLIHQNSDLRFALEWIIFAPESNSESQTWLGCILRSFDQSIFHSETADSSTLKFGRTGSGDLSSELYRRLIWAVGRVWALFNHPDGQTATPKHFGMLSKAFWTLYNPDLPPTWDFGSEDLTG